MGNNLAEDSLIKKYLPFESKYIQISGYNMHYLDVYDDINKPIVLLLHGNPTWCFFYRNLIQELKSDFRLIAPDYIGLGLSDHPENTHYRVSHRVNQVNDLIKKLNINKFSIVMHDWGGSIGTSLAVKNVEKIERLVYLNTTLTETESLPGIIKNAAKPLIGKFLTKTSKSFLRTTTNLGVAKKLPKDIKKSYFLPYKTKKNRTAIWDFVADIPFDSKDASYADMLDLAEKIPLLKEKPVKIIWGLKDPCFHKEMLNNVAAHFPQADVLELPSASHLVLEDEPEICNSEIKSFLLSDKKQITQKIKDVSSLDHPSLYGKFLEQVSINPYNFAAIDPLFIGKDVKYSQINYKDLNAEVNKYQRGLVKLGLKENDKVLMLVTPSTNFLSLTYAVLARGAVPYFVDPGMGKENLFNTIKEINPDILLSSIKGRILKLLKPSLFKNLKFCVTASNWVYFFGPTTRYLNKFSNKPLTSANYSDTAFVAYTSGGTGKPKGVIYTHKMLNAQLDILKDDFGLQVGKKDLPLLPIFSIFNLANGICSVFAPINVSKPLELDPTKIVKLINDLKINYSFGSPTLWKKISEYCVRSNNKLFSIEKIFIAGTAVPKDTLKRLNEVLDNGKVYTPYGSTECLPVTLIKSDKILKLNEVPSKNSFIGTLVGKSVNAINIKIVDSIEDGQEFNNLKFLDKFEIGEILVKGDNVSLSYTDSTHNIKSKLTDKNGDIWHRMGDFGYLDSEDNLYFCGRVFHSVNLENKTLYPVPVEKIFNVHPKVSRSALVDLAEDGYGVVIEPVSGNFPEFKKDQDSFKKSLLDLTTGVEYLSDLKYIFFHNSFPVDGRHNAKIFRDKLSVWAKSELKK